MRSHVLFLCVANSARSQMAEGLARAVAPDGVVVHSAGSSPATVHPGAVLAMREIGIDIGSHRSKGIDEVPLDCVTKVVTLCAEEVCPQLPDVVERVHWPLPDPAAPCENDADQAAAFAAVRDLLQSRIATLLA